MTENELKDRYFTWLYQLVSENNIIERSSYRKLLKKLDSIEFRYSLPMDGNRAEDGIDLRYRFGYDNLYEQPYIASYLDNKPCSVLEMMVALALRCEEDIAYNPDLGNRTGVWFYTMIDSLGLADMDDFNYDEKKVITSVNKMLERSFCSNGKGGLFTIQGNKDMREIEIWYQMCWYLDELLNDEIRR